MHQPYYKNDFDDVYELPWVFLHAIKDYYTMPSYINKYDNVKAVFNLVPSLLVQIDEYAAKKADDIFIRLVNKKVVDLTSGEINSIVPTLFMANVEHMILPSKRYAELFNKYERINGDGGDFSKFSENEIRDLEVLFLLSWTGISIKEDEKLVDDLVSQDRNFSEIQKIDFLAILFRKISEIIPLYKKLQDEGKIEISTTPFYHPIIPLLLDTGSAREAAKEVILPRKSIQGYDDACWHIEEAKQYHTNCFNRSPEGMWPSEGSISDESVRLFGKSGLKWIASDEDVLAGSIKKSFHNEANRNLIYQKYIYHCGNESIHIFCRDKVLSDLIGFSYSDLDGEKAADDFIKRLRRIYDNNEENIHVSVILDGENAWEYYPSGGSKFFKNLYGKISTLGWLETATFSEIIQNKTIPTQEISHIRAGSWIYGNLLTWIGHEEKNKAWELLNEARSRTKKASMKLSKDEKEKMKKELYIAEGSDWFWWYGDDHFSLQSDVFDRLFRSHLVNAYKISGVAVPAKLYVPIKKAVTHAVIKKPSAYIVPVIDGYITNYFEWLAAGLVNLKYDIGAMHSDSNLLNKLYWGYDKEYLYFRLEGDVHQLMNKGYNLDIEIITDKKIHLLCMLEEQKFSIIEENHEQGEKFLMKACEIIEIRFPLKNIYDNLLESIHLMFRLKKEGRVIEKDPKYNLLKLDIDRSLPNDWMV